MTIDGWCYYKGISWGKNVQIQIPQIELNLVLNIVYW
jgi:hypothetical protein